MSTKTIKQMLFSSAVIQLMLSLYAKCDVIGRYMADEARSLKQYGEIPDTGLLGRYGRVCVTSVC